MPPPIATQARVKDKLTLQDLYLPLLQFSRIVGHQRIASLSFSFAVAEACNVVQGREAKVSDRSVGREDGTAESSKQDERRKRRTGPLLNSH